MTKYYSSPARGKAYKYAGEHGATKKTGKNVLELITGVLRDSKRPKIKMKKKMHAKRKRGKVR
jgi:hypothetical protein